MLVLLSGGLDSAANLALACRRSDISNPKLCVTVDYGQRAAQQEIRAARGLCDFFSVEHRVLNLEWFSSLAGGALTKSQHEMPEFEQDELDHPEKTQKSAQAVWVPNRNGLLINIAASVAESLSIDQVTVGFNREEATTFADNSAEFIQAINHGLSFSTRNQVRVECWTVDMSKSEMVATLQKEVPDFPMELVWSCYQSGDERCGKCESCQRFERATHAWKK